MASAAVSFQQALEQFRGWPAPHDPPSAVARPTARIPWSIIAVDVFLSPEGAAGRMNLAARDNRTRRGAPLVVVEHLMRRGGRR